AREQASVEREIPGIAAHSIEAAVHSPCISRIDPRVVPDSPILDFGAHGVFGSAQPSAENRIRQHDSLRTCVVLPSQTYPAAQSVRGDVAGLQAGKTRRKNR